MAAISFRRGAAGVVPNSFLIQPKIQDGGPPVVAVHGLRREAERMAELLCTRAEETGRTVILPVFDQINWRLFQRAACPQRADWAMLCLLDTLRDKGLVRDGPVDMSGYSGGAQFAHRFAWLYPDRVGRLCLTAPGWWTFPDMSGVYPYGMATPEGDTSQGPFWLRANLHRFLDREISVRVGAQDCVADDNLRSNPRIDAQQGPHRVLRARRWCAAAVRACRHAGIRPQIDFRLLEGCGHNFADCVTAAGLDKDFVQRARPDAAAPAARSAQANERRVA